MSKKVKEKSVMVRVPEPEYLVFKSKVALEGITVKAKLVQLIIKYSKEEQ